MLTKKDLIPGRYIETINGDRYHIIKTLTNELFLMSCEPTKQKTMIALTIFSNDLTCRNKDMEIVKITEQNGKTIWAKNTFITEIGTIIEYIDDTNSETTIYVKKPFKDVMKKITVSPNPIVTFNKEKITISNITKITEVRINRKKGTNDRKKRTSYA